MILKKLTTGIALLTVLLCMSCKEEALFNKPYFEGNKPGQVSNIEIAPLNGAAEISYELPPKDALYVLAEYAIRPGVIRQAKSSKYKNTVKIEGFGTEGTYDVTLYAISEGEVKSDPLVIQAQILTPPIMTTYNNLEYSPVFGGIRIESLNQGRGDLTIDVLTLNEENELEKVHTQYTSQENISFAVRGFESEPREFLIAIRDRWGNLADTIRAEVTPWFEEKLDRRLMRQHTLPTDNVAGHKWGALTEREIHHLFDGITHDGDNLFHTLPAAGIPLHFTITLGERAKLSRFKIWPRNQEPHFFAGSTPRHFKVWGSNAPNPNGSFDSSWTLIGEYEIVKPSGNPIGQNTAEDLQAYSNGFDFDVPLEIPPVTYIRIQVIDSWGGLSYMSFSELEFWGTYQ
ncbi:MAG TPA: DUF5000 domain-containing lipoprotein [Sphingobacterium sp.]|nr:DUF5000 domain-containing lipoprotein [Sphingobacterium sp.]